MIKFFYIVVLLLVGITSCKQEKLNDKNSFSRYPQVEKNLLFDYYIKPNQEFLNLYSLDKGIDSFEMRIYVSYALSSKEDLYIVKATKDSLIKSHYYFIPQIEYHPDGTIGKLENSFVFMRKFSFLNCDTSFINLFNKSKISSLPTLDSIKNLSGGCTDGIGYTVEISTKNTYRLINYSNPDCYENSEESKKFAIFIKSFLSSVKETSFPQNYTIDYLISN